MTTLAKLLAQKEELLKRIEENPGPSEREEIDRLMEKINIAIHLRRMVMRSEPIESGGR